MERNPKFYVSCGELQMVLTRPTPKDAAVDALVLAFESGEPILLNTMFVKVSEWGYGFDREHGEDDVFFQTDEIILGADVKIVEKIG